MDFTNRGPLVLISQFQSPQQLADAGQTEVEQWLRGHKVRHADRLAAAAVRAAATQHTRVVGEATAADLIARLARAVLDLDRQLADIDKRISTRFEVHRHHAIITSMVGIGNLLGASSSLPLAAVSTGSPPQITWPATPDSRPHPGTRDDAPATCTGRSATTANSSASSTPRR